MHTERNRQMNKERFNVLSIPGLVIKKNPSHGARHGPSVRQTMYFKAHDVLRKGSNPINDTCKTILERWYKDDKYRKSLSDIGWTEEQIKQYDALASEDHSYVASPEERSHDKKSWKFSLNREGMQGPLNQRPDFFDAKHKCKILYEEHTARTGEGTANQTATWTTIQGSRWEQLHSWSSNRTEILPYIFWTWLKFFHEVPTWHAQRRSCVVELLRRVWVKSHRETCRVQHLRLRQHTGNTMTIGSRIKVGIPGEPHPGLNSKLKFPLFRWSFPLPEISCPGNRRSV